MISVYYFVFTVLFVSPASGILSNPGPLCSGQRTTFICEITGGVELEWLYNNGQVMSIAQINPGVNLLPPLNPVVVAGVEFSVSLVDPVLSSEISFVPTIMMNNTRLICLTILTTSSTPSIDSVTLQVLNISKSIKKKLH